MTASPITASPPAPRPFLRTLAEHNPFYLLSAACMLGGCVALTNTLSFDPIGLRKILILIATLNVYELMLIGLASYLILHRGLLRDGIILLILAAFFLVDSAFLNAEVFSINVFAGLIVNIVLFALGMVKVMLIFRAAGISLLSGLYPFVNLQLGVLFLSSGVLADVSMRNDGDVHVGVFYVLWWIVGLLPIVAMCLVPRRAGRGETSRPASLPGVARLMLILPFASFLVHLVAANWVYETTFHLANLAPLLLGLAVTIGASSRHVTSLALRMRIELLLPVVAIVTAITFPAELVFGEKHFVISPLRLTLIGAACVYVHGMILFQHGYFVIAAAMCMGVAGMGVSIRTIVDSFTSIWRWIIDSARVLTPRTTTHWGVLSVIASFALLALGAAVSLLKGPPSAQASEPPLDVEPTA